MMTKADRRNLLCYMVQAHLSYSLRKDSIHCQYEKGVL